MIKIDVKKSKNLDSALKVLKTKFDKTGTKKELLQRKEFVKKSVLRREKLNKAKYKESINRNSDLF
jgi:small subunit ribosomal protein S21